MAEANRIGSKRSNSLIEEMDGVAYMEESNKIEFIKEAMKLYIRERRRIQILEAMKTGYLEMSSINRKLSELGLSDDIRDLISYETVLLGRESF